jgi:dTDP-4-dehydrorhamnose reductase
MSTILVTGASGQLGSELRDLSSRFSGYTFLFTDQEEMDITDANQSAIFINSASPDWIINCAAYTAVDKAEGEADLAHRINATGVQNIVKAIAGTECRLIHISTDYVFDGKKNTPYQEDDVTGPMTVYGNTKLAGEMEALKHPYTMIIRTSWLYSSYGNNFVKTIIKKAGSSDNIGVVFDQTGSPTYAADLASAIMEIISGTIRNRHVFSPGIFNYANEGVCSWFDFAIEIVKAVGSTSNVRPLLTTDWPSPAARPQYSVFNKKKIKETYNLTIPYWRDSLLKCISKLSKSNG